MSNPQLPDTSIILLGAPRSGTTLLAQVLRRHPSVAYWKEPRILWKYGNELRSDLLSPRHATSSVRRYIRGQINEYVRSEGKTHYFEKLPNHSLRMEFVEEVLPGCKFIHIRRSPAASISSIRAKWLGNAEKLPAARLKKRVKEASLRQYPRYTAILLHRLLKRLGLQKKRTLPFWGPELPGMRQLVDELRLVEVAALQWRYCTELAAAYGSTLPEDRYLEISLEELDVTMLRKVMQFANLSLSPDVEEFFMQKLNSERQHKSPYQLSEQDVTLIRRWVPEIDSSV